MTLRYDTRSRLLIRPYEKQQVDVRKVINHSANMAASRPVACLVFLFSLSVSVKRNRWWTSTLNRCTRCSVRPTHILQHTISVWHFAIKFPVMLLVSKYADPWHEKTNLVFICNWIYE